MVFPLGSLNEVVLVADFADGGGGRHLDAARAEVEAHGFGVGHFDGDVEEAFGIGGHLRAREQLHRLAIVDLDPDEIATGGARNREGRGEAEVSFVEGAGSCDVADVEGGVGDAGDVGAVGGRGLLG